MRNREISLENIYDGPSACSQLGARLDCVLINVSSVDNCRNGVPRENNIGSRYRAIIARGSLQSLLRFQNRRRRRILELGRIPIIRIPCAGTVRGRTASRYMRQRDIREKGIAVLVEDS